MVYIYILKLQQNKWYIGKTNNPKFRLDQHFNRNGSAWTKKYPPLDITEFIPNCTGFDEDKYTIIYMSMYGVANVRGGSFCQLDLSDDIANIINRMIWGATDKCVKCGSMYHFVKDCLIKNNICYRCGRTNHTDKNCYATKDIDGKQIIEIWECEFCRKKFNAESDMIYHENFICNRLNQILKN